MPVPPPSAEAFATAVLRVARLKLRPVVVKLGGSAMEDPTATDACLRSVVTLHHLGFTIALVHGGGKPIDRAMTAAGLTPRKVAGRRYTDPATLEIVVRVLKEINEDLCRRLNALATTPDCHSVMGRPVWNALAGEPLRLTGSGGESIDLGRVGAVTEVYYDGILSPIIYGDSHVPVIPSFASDRDGWLNVNADTAAAAVAGAMKADKAIFLTDTPGVLRDRANPDSLIPSLSEREARELITAGMIDGGMVPKVEACFEALAAGAKSALILDGRVPYSLLDVFLRDTFQGTAITR